MDTIPDKKKQANLKILDCFNVNSKFLLQDVHVDGSVTYKNLDTFLRTIVAMFTWRRDVRIKLIV